MRITIYVRESDFGAIKAKQPLLEEVARTVLSHYPSLEVAVQEGEAIPPDKHLMMELHYTSEELHTAAEREAEALVRALQDRGVRVLAAITYSDGGRLKTELVIETGELETLAATVATILDRLGLGDRSTIGPL